MKSHMYGSCGSHQATGQRAQLSKDSRQTPQKTAVSTAVFFYVHIILIKRWRTYWVWECNTNS